MNKTYIQGKAIIFDMDGVITDTMPYHYRAWKIILQREGIHATKEDIYLREGQPGKQTVKEIFRLYRKPLSFKKTKEMLDAKEIYFKKIVQKGFIRGSRSFIKKMAKKNFLLALVTGTSRREVKRILPGELYDSFLVIITGDEVRYGKPHPEPYLKALKKLKINPGEAIVIENAPFGIESAKAAGLRCVTLETSLSKTYLKKADFIFSSFKNFVKHIEFQKIL